MSRAVYADTAHGRLGAQPAMDDPGKVAVWYAGGPMIGYYNRSRFEGGKVTAATLRALFGEPRVEQEPPAPEHLTPVAAPPLMPAHVAQIIAAHVLIGQWCRCGLAPAVPTDAAHAAHVGDVVAQGIGPGVRFERDGATFTVTREYAPGMWEARSGRGEIVLPAAEIAAYLIAATTDETAHEREIERSIAEHDAYLADTATD